ncbi:MAG: glutamate--tRNA ligase family protein [Candidatus Vogelbacteria bacterium]|nr:glutamate--tRNA ligase family protein [Candidatus Vogelbacteria bacterium]
MKLNSDRKIITRFAPSPTGFFHIGGARTALFIYLFTKQNNGKYILRIEDTDKERSKPEYEEDILASLKWLGLAHDEFVRQSENIGYHKKCLKDLIDKDLAYVSKEELSAEESEKKLRTEVIRFRNPNKKVTFQDLIHGEISFDTTELGDFVIAKDLDTPIFHLANVADDILSGITHIVRGEEHISNTPRQILIFEALGAETIPTYAHIPLILDKDRAKLSKRKHGASVWVNEYKKLGYFPEALINYLAILGWSPQAGNNDAPEIFSLQNLLKNFDIIKVQKRGAIFDTVKLNWINHEYLKNISTEVKKQEVKSRCPDRIKSLPDYSAEMFEKIIPLIAERISYYGEVSEILEKEDFDFFFKTPVVDEILLKSAEHLPAVIDLLQQIDESDFNAEKIKSAIWDFATEKGRGVVLWPMRVALTGQEKSPDPFTVASILGKEETIVRLANAQKNNPN